MFINTETQWEFLDQINPENGKLNRPRRLHGQPLLVFIDIISSCPDTAMSIEQRVTPVPKPCYTRMAPGKIRSWCDWPNTHHVSVLSIFSVFSQTMFGSFSIPTPATTMPRHYSAGEIILPIQPHGFTLEITCRCSLSSWGCSSQFLIYWEFIMMGVGFCQMFFPYQMIWSHHFFFLAY